jgi:hypothetical protein
MARSSKVDDNAIKLAQLENENLLLKQKILDQEAVRESMAKISSPNLSSEIMKIQRRNKGGVNSINVTEKNDHRNITLWTRDGQSIGPLHPTNAEHALNEHASRGIFLTVERPTQAQIEAYCKTPEYKEIVRKEEVRRANKMGTRKRGNLEKLTAEIAKSTGQLAENLNKVLDRPVAR